MSRVNGKSVGGGAGEEKRREEGKGEWGKRGRGRGGRRRKWGRGEERAPLDSLPWLSDMSSVTKLRHGGRI